MPTEVFEEALDLEIYAVEAIPISTALGDHEWRSYPYAPLRTTKDVRELTTRAVILDNSYLRLTVLPELGGRLLSIFDKRTNKDVLPRSKRLQAESGGNRGVWLKDGIQFHVGQWPRPNSMGPTNLQIVDSDEGSIPGVWIGECSGPISFNAFIGLPHDRAEVLVEVRCFNRTLEWQTATAGLSVFVGEGETWQQDSDTVFYSARRDVGLCLAVAPALLPARRFTDGLLEAERFHSGPETLGPRQLDTWSLRLLPFGGVGKPDRVTAEGAVSLGETLRMQTTTNRAAHMLFLLTEDGQTVEAPADIYPEQPLDISLSSLPAKPVALVVRDSNKEEVFRIETGEREPPESLPAGEGEAPLKRSFRELAYLSAVERLREHQDPGALLTVASFRPELKAPCAVVEGLHRLSQGDYLRAVESFDDALSHNAEDHLTWWYKALAHRLSGESSDDRPELVNAHFLAPLEPVLRSESFLRMGPALGSEASPLLEPLSENPEQFVEVACLLLEAGLFAEATRWIDEALRHHDFPMLRYLLAYAYLSGSRMTVEAADQLRRAASLPLSPPYPWRKIELLALSVLAERFAEDVRLTEYRRLVAAFLNSLPPRV